uniref:Uncharacterized protein n=1 Tax=Chromera velia CCMP2878 TaxID=1169474 RepID=A0A0K6SB09_9ALVE|eukprot:Cvel_12760.t1-p1 / transcript=Cvel_12760.t1 / gene=Cvel_12760 / organism=Chromera_velia_CCMP2878 / gene_product=hypothetical protein / transcript_product=hypothetical protein / location=Cvel_scaffold848:44729-54990(-) / protein_length=211 / sequence_SO=supercontig / SO=protein_coding / is_pseudo=false
MSEGSFGKGGGAAHLRGNGVLPATLPCLPPLWLCLGIRKVCPGEYVRPPPGWISPEERERERMARRAAARERRREAAALREAERLRSDLVPDENPVLTSDARQTRGSTGRLPNGSSKRNSNGNISDKDSGVQQRRRKKINLAGAGTQGAIMIIQTDPSSSSSTAPPTGPDPAAPRTTDIGTNQIPGAVEVTTNVSPSRIPSEATGADGEAA